MSYTFNPFSGKLDVTNKEYPYSATKQPTGFTDTGNTIVSYDSSTRKVALTGTVVGYWQGSVVPNFSSGWVSDAHPDTSGIWYLYYNCTSFVWSQTVWTYDLLQIAFVNYGTDKFGIKETHGFMQYETHKELHQTFGTYLQSGGDLSNYVLSSTTAANRRPNVSATYVNDEDITSTIPLLSSSLYTKYYLSGAGATSTFTVETTDIVPLSTNQPYYNQFTGGVWQQTLMSTSNYQALWLIAIPTTSDAGSLKYRYLWMQGQSQSLNLPTIQALTPSNLNLGQLSA